MTIQEGVLKEVMVKVVMMGKTPEKKTGEQEGEGE